MEFVKVPSTEDINKKALQTDNQSLNTHDLNTTENEPSASSEFINAKIEEITGGALETKDSDLQSRISECKSLIESLKKELHEDRKPDAASSGSDSECSSSSRPGELCVGDCRDPHSSDSSLLADDSVAAYEAQLNQYQATLSMAHAEKRNAIRREMAAKAYKLKLLEAERACGAELARVRRGLRALEPLRALVARWAAPAAAAAGDDDTYQLMPMYTHDVGGDEPAATDLDAKTDREDSVVCDIA